MDDTSSLLQSINKATLTPLVRQALDSETAEVVEWDCEPLRGGMSDAAVYRWSGIASVGAEEASWSMILKIMRDEKGAVDPNHWKREALACQSGMLADLPGGLRAPKCFGVAQRPSGDYWVWMEEVHDAFGHEWTLEHYGTVARHMGQFNGAYLAGMPLPPYLWLVTAGVRNAFARRASVIERLRDAEDHPLLRRGFPPDVAEGLLRVWDERELLAIQLDRLPKTLCHGDAGKVNLCLRRRTGGRYETVAIDWGNIGIGEVAEYLTSLALGPLYMREFDLSQGADVESVAFDGYLYGLRDAGWLGAEQQLRLGYLVDAALHFGIFVPRIAIGVLLDESRHAWAEEYMGMPLDEMVDWGAEFRRFLLRRVDELWGMLDSL